MANYQLTAESRNVTGTAEVKKLRNNDQIPGNVYGLNTNTLVSVNVRDFEKAFQSGANLIDLMVDGEKRPVLVKEIQRNPVKGTYQHIDFLEVALDRLVDTIVGIMIADDVTQTKDGGIVNLVMRQLNISCLPGDIPDTIYVNVADLKIGSVVSVNDLELADSVTVTDDIEEVVVTITAPVSEEEPDEDEDVDMGDVEVVGEENNEESEEA